jgi:hypothetical protein
MKRSKISFISERQQTNLSNGVEEAKVLIRFAARLMSEPQWHPFLDVVIAVIEASGGRHMIDPAQYGDIARSNWLKDASGPRASTLEIIRASTRVTERAQPSDAVTIILDEKESRAGNIETPSRVRIHPFGGLALLLQPLFVIVEDESSDGAFLLWVARVLGLDSIRRAYRQGHIQFRHAGGKHQLSKSARALTYGVWDQGKPIFSLRLRAVGVLDSDSRYPEAQPNSAIVEELKKHVAFVHQLKRRSIENYVPEKYFRSRMSGPQHGFDIDAYFRLSEVQRSHFPLKSGFRQSGSGAVQDHEQFLLDPQRDMLERDLYRDVPAGDWIRIAAGLGDTLADVYREEKYRCDQGGEPRLLPADVREELAGLLTSLIQHL